MLFDQPFAGVKDPLAITDIREVIGYLKGRGIGILITDHNVRETLDIIDRASIIASGEVLFEGTPDEVLANPEVRAGCYWRPVLKKASPRAATARPG